MGLEIYWLQLAENKLEDIYIYYSTIASKKIARSLVNGIVNRTIDLANQPKIGQVESSLTSRKQEFRYLVYKNYKVVYWINYDFNRVEIANVFDTRQNPIKIGETL
jgi:plasmid stabilization system protein ParE